MLVGSLLVWDYTAIPSVSTQQVAKQPILYVVYISRCSCSLLFLRESMLLRLATHWSTLLHSMLPSNNMWAHTLTTIATAVNTHLQWHRNSIMQHSTKDHIVLCIAGPSTSVLIWWVFRGAVPTMYVLKWLSIVWLTDLSMPTSGSACMTHQMKELLHRAYFDAWQLSTCRLMQWVNYWLTNRHRSKDAVFTSPPWNQTILARDL